VFATAVSGRLNNKGIQMGRPSQQTYAGRPLTRRVALIAAIVLAPMSVIILSSQARAQALPENPGPADAATLASDGSLAEVLVTAQRHEERLVDVPISIASVGGAQLQQAGITSLVDVAQVTPGLRFDSEGANVEPTIRGVGTLLTGPGLKPNVPVYVDGYYVPTEPATNLQLLSVSRIDVLKGPQGTLFGRNATGGAVLVQTLDPSFDPTLTARVSDGSYAKRDVAVYGSAPVTDTLAGNIAGYWQRGDGYITNINSGSDEDGAFRNWEVRSKLLYQPLDSLRVLLILDHADIDDPTLVADSAYDGLAAANVIPGIRIASGPWNTAQGFVSSNRDTTDSISLTAHYDSAVGTLSSYTQYRYDKAVEHFDSDITAAPLLYSVYPIYDNTFTQELNLASTPGGPFSWVTGLYLYRNLNVYNPYDTASAGRPLKEVFSTENPSHSYAAYADGTYEVLSRLFLTAGVRYTEDRISEYFNLIHVRTGSAEDSFRNWSPRGVLRYQLTPSSNVYASFTEGYKSGALPAASFSTVPLKPESIRAYEVGYKITAGALQFEASAFHYNYTNLQVSTFQGFSSIDTNAAQSTIYGADAHVRAQIHRDLTLNLGGSFVHAVYDDYPNASGYVQNLNKASPAYGLFTSALVGATGNPFDATGNTLPRAPRFTSSIGLSYSHRFSVGGLELDANDYYTTKVYFDPVNQFSQGAYSVLNLRGTWWTPDNRWAFSVYGTNVANEIYRDQVLPGSYGIRQTYGPPAQFGGSVTLHL
jgi:iron complex outermembrane recepter protein